MANLDSLCVLYELKMKSKLLPWFYLLEYFQRYGGFLKPFYLYSPQSQGSFTEHI